MKTKTILITFITLAILATSRANLIDLTPGGFDLTQPYPQEFLHFIGQVNHNRITFFDAASSDGWANTGALNGGQFFFTDLIGNPESSAAVSWDFSTLPDWSMSVLLVEGGLWAHLYAVPQNFQITDFGDLVTLHDGLNIDFLSFYGRNPDSAPIPDSGTTWELMAMCLGGLFVFKRR